MTSDPASASATAFPALMAPPGGYVFIVTYGRSGSTLTQAYLNSFPGYCIRGESNNLILDLCRMIKRLEVTNFTWRREDAAKPAAKRRPFLREILGTPVDPWYGAELVDPDRLARGLCDVFVREALHLPPGTRVGGFKDIGWGLWRRFPARGAGGDRAAVPESALRHPDPRA
jgi:hypothetical protein